MDTVKNNQIIIVYVTDGNYAMPTCVSIVSLIEHINKEQQYHIFIIGIGLSGLQIERFKELEQDNVDISIISGDNEKNKRYTEACETAGTHVSITALCKFDIPDLIKQDKAIYLDGDIIINSDVSDLFATDLNGYYLAAVDDMGDEYDDKGSSLLALRIGLDEKRYFNSGVMLFNLEKMRQDNIREKLIDYRENGKNYFVDQDAFNYVLGKHRLPLDYKYNFMGKMFDETGFEETNDIFFQGRYKDALQCLNDQCILHLTYKYKPWIYHTGWLTEIFRKYYEKSPYRQETLRLESIIKTIVEMKNLEQRLLSRYFRTLNKWLELRNNGVTLLQHSMLQDKTVSVYGMGKLGRRFIEEFNISGREIAFAVDRVFTDLNAGFKIYGICGQLPYSDTMVVTITDEFDSIKETVKKIFDGRIVSLEDIVNDLWEEHCGNQDRVQ